MKLDICTELEGWGNLPLSSIFQSLDSPGKKINQSYPPRMPQYEGCHHPNLEKISPFSMMLHSLELQGKMKIQCFSFFLDTPGLKLNPQP